MLLILRGFFARQSSQPPPVQRSVFLKLALVFLAVGLPGCAHGSLELVSAGFTSCSEREITISEDSGNEGGTRTWSATCHGEQYRCRAVWDGEHAQTVAVGCAPAGR